MKVQNCIQAKDFSQIEERRRSQEGSEGGGGTKKYLCAN